MSDGFAPVFGDYAEWDELDPRNDFIYTDFKGDELTCGCLHCRRLIWGRLMPQTGKAF